MKLYKPIQSDHPYFKDDKLIEEPGMRCIRKTYQPCEGSWPLYSLSIRRIVPGLYSKDGGITVDCSYKRDMKSWWEGCDYMEPSPASLVLVLGTMIHDIYEDVVQSSDHL